MSSGSVLGDHQHDDLRAELALDVGQVLLHRLALQAVERVGAVDHPALERRHRHQVLRVRAGRGPAPCTRRRARPTTRRATARRCCVSRSRPSRAFSRAQRPGHHFDAAGAGLLKSTVGGREIAASFSTVNDGLTE